ncbi:MAG: hypothetical protein A2782_04165 [Candidatus Blackburnbacteria bacterium RIFCSPHIGHO2_01_FULL_43_15b]|uniref:Uncharacterized protein n=1 Tax=Candidatus Blackburnbacteria bacterium RIFCSPHIGHO2_01_FULL_43_15b TaxID=1797513 RepID=A0A1G1UZX5_9BACT|nr:MAG: hypothetical protein A2782_04165 [Candidatus Blackburnbacteria bacterium RIFCSPHIGHO2_01_FULL_43_15b]
MITPQAQIKLNLPLPLKERAESQASKFGVPLATYLKHLIMQDTEDMDYPVFEPSERTIKAYKQALKNKNKAIFVENIDEYFKNL